MLEIKRVRTVVTFSTGVCQRFKTDSRSRRSSMTVFRLDIVSYLVWRRKPIKGAKKHLRLSKM